VRLVRGVSALAGLAVLVHLTAGCETRSRTNPFDPRNPDTGGTPPLLHALADSGSVDLSWELGAFRDVRGVRVLRRPEGGAEAVAFSFSEIGPGAVVDRGLANGNTWSYRLEVDAPSGLLSSAVVVATPGGSAPWMGDAAGGGVVRLTPDGRGVRFRVEPGRVVVDLAMEGDGSFWAADYENGAVVASDREGRRRAVFGLSGVSTLAVDAADGRLWVGSFDERVVFYKERDGRTIWADSSAGMVERVRAAPGGGAWVASRDHAVSFLREGAVLFRARDLVRPAGLAVDASGRAWVTDRGDGTVYRYAPGGLLREKSGASFNSPRDADSDGSGGVWIADPGRGGVVHLDSSLRETAFVACSDAQAVAWDAPNRRLWVCRPSIGRVDVFAVAPDEMAEETRLLTSLAVGGRPVVVQGVWRR
jgi:sugar lactone lactonase YvrE